MKLIFVDETDRQANAQKRQFFCICGLIVDDENIISVTKGLEKIKNDFGLANLKDSRTTSMDKAAKIEFTEAVSLCLQEHDVQVIGIVLGDFSMSFDMPVDDIYMGAMSFLMERFALTLKKAGTSGTVFFDCLEKTLEKKIREKFYTYIQETPLQMSWSADTLGQMKDFILPTLNFVDDQESILVQAVDLIATSLNSAIVNTNREKFDVNIDDLPSGNEFLNLYWPLFVSSPKGKVSGWGIKVWN